MASPIDCSKDVNKKMALRMFCVRFYSLSRNAYSINSKHVTPCNLSALLVKSPCGSLSKKSVTLSFSRCYAKGKDRKKDSKQKTVAVNENVLSQAIDVEDLRNEMDKVINKMKEDFVKHFSLRSSTGSIDTLPVDFEGNEYTLQDVAQIGKKNPNMYVVSLTSFPQLIPNVIKSIQSSGLGLNPQQEGTTLFIPIPKITKEHRETMSKNAKAVFIRTRDALRDVQNRFIKSAKNKEGLSEDVFFSIKNQVTYIADGRIAEAESILKAKQEELKG